jgi:hypothetical protein
LRLTADEALSRGPARILAHVFRLHQDLCFSLHRISRVHGLCWRRLFQTSTMLWRSCAIATEIGVCPLLVLADASAPRERRMRASEALPVAACTVYNKYHNATSLARDTRRMAIVRLNYRMVETGPTRIVTTVHKVRSRIQNLCQSSGQLGCQFPVHACQGSLTEACRLCCNLALLTSRRLWKRPGAG